jgi:hypothetical protein
VDATNVNAKGGVMLRDGTNAKAMYVDLVLTPSKVLMTARTSSTGSAINIATGGIHPPPYWVKLVRTGTNTFSGYTSSDGTTWGSAYGSATVNIPAASTEAGLCETACDNSGVICRSIISNVSAQ